MSSHVPSRHRFAMDLALLLLSNSRRNSSCSRLNAGFCLSKCLNYRSVVQFLLPNRPNSDIMSTALWISNPRSEFAWVVLGPHLIFRFLLDPWISERIWNPLVFTIRESEAGTKSSGNYHSLDFPWLARLTTSSLIWANRNKNRWTYIPTDLVRPT